MYCLKCKRSQEQVLLLKMPFETIYEDKNLIFMGNVKEDDYICLPCIGYQFDEVFEEDNKAKQWFSDEVKKAENWLWQYYGIEPN